MASLGGIGHIVAQGLGGFMQGDRRAREDNRRDRLDAQNEELRGYQMRGLQRAEGAANAADADRVAIGKIAQKYAPAEGDDSAAQYKKAMAMALEIGAYKGSQGDADAAMASLRKAQEWEKENIVEANKLLMAGDIPGFVKTYNANGKQIDPETLQVGSQKNPITGQELPVYRWKHTDGTEATANPFFSAIEYGKVLTEAAKAQAQEAAKNPGRELEHKQRLEIEGKKHGYSMAEIAARGTQDRQTKAVGDGADGGGVFKATEGVKVLASRYGGKFEGGMWFPDEANKDVALRANQLLEEKLAQPQYQGKPMDAAAAAAQQAEREKATGNLPIGRPPAGTQPAAAGGASDYSNLWK